MTSKPLPIAHYSKSVFSATTRYQDTMEYLQALIDDADKPLDDSKAKVCQIYTTFSAQEDFYGHAEYEGCELARQLGFNLTTIVERDNGDTNNNVYENIIDYQPNIDYGYEVNYKLFNYFLFAQRKYKMSLGGGFRTNRIN